MRISTCDVNGGLCWDLPLSDTSVELQPLCYQEEMPSGPDCSHSLGETMHMSEKAAMDILASADAMGSKNQLPLLSPIQSTNS